MEQFLSSAGPLVGMLTVRETGPAAESNAWLLGAFLGALLVMAFYHLTLFAAVRESSFLYYALYLLALAGSCVLWEEILADRASLDDSTWARASYAMVDALAAISALQFTRVFLGTKERLRRWDHVLIGLLWISALVIPLSVGIFWKLAMELNSLLALIGPGAILVAGFLCWRQGFRPARFLLVAFAVHLIGVTVDTVLEYATPLSSELMLLANLTYYGGAVLMAILFSLALADRYNEQLRRRHQAEAEQHALREYSYKDGLTGIWNRRRFDETLAQEWQRAARHGQPVSLILIDVDHFKKYNDGYGHQAGDDCLRRVAQALDKAATRAADLVARYGGEEFAVLVPDSDVGGAAGLAEEMRAAVARLGIPHEYSTADSCVTISVGVAGGIPSAARRPQELVEAADQALYESKKSGRNCVSCGAFVDTDPWLRAPNGELVAGV